MSKLNTILHYTVAWSLLLSGSILLTFYLPIVNLIYRHDPLPENAYYLSPSARKSIAQLGLDAVTRIWNSHSWNKFINITQQKYCLTSGEIKHMYDVRTLIVYLWYIFFGCIGISAYLFSKNKSFAHLCARNAAQGILLFTLVLAIGAYWYFDELFELMHKVLFPPNSWIFDVRCALIQVYPEWFWQAAGCGMAFNLIIVCLIALYISGKQEKHVH